MQYNKQAEQNATLAPERSNHAHLPTFPWANRLWPKLFCHLMVRFNSDNIRLFILVLGPFLLIRKESLEHIKRFREKRTLDPLLTVPAIPWGVQFKGTSWDRWMVTTLVETWVCSKSHPKPKVVTSTKYPYLM